MFIMSLSKLFWLCKLGVLIFFVLLILGLKLKETYLIVIGVIILVIVFLVFIFKYRCPYCHKLLNSRKLVPVKVCPCCGKKLK